MLIGQRSQQDHDALASWGYPPVNNANWFSLNNAIGPALFAWIATLKFYEKIDRHNVEEGVRRLGSYAIEALEDIGCRITSPLIRPNDME